MSRFSLSTIANKTIIRDIKTGVAGELYQEGKSWLVELEDELPAGWNEKKKSGLEKRMADWYVFTQVQPQAK